MDAYLRWAENHAAGVAAASAHTASRRYTGDTLASVRRTNNERHPCKIKGCKRTAYKGSLCKRHWQMVPLAARVSLQVDVMESAKKVAARHHRRFLRIVQDQLS